MSYYFITFRSVTHAQRGEKLLQKEGIRCSLQRTPRWREERGGGYCLRLKSRDAARAVQLLRLSGVAFNKVLSAREQGGMEELAL